jgi:Flp pilus assembly protein TadB
MPFGRGFATAFCLILIALTCIAIAKRLERERRLLRKLRENGTISLDAMSENERDTAESLRHAGVLRMDRDRGYVQPAGLQEFRRKRVRFALSGALVALVLALLVAVVLLR